MAKAATTSKKERAYKRKRRRRQTTAVVFMVLALVGTITIGTVAFRFVKNTFFDDTREKERFAAMIAPLVTQDPAPFTSLDKADPDLLLQASIRAALINNDITKYERLDDSILLPSIDVARAAAEIFGPGYTLTHRTISVGGVSLNYRASTGHYVVPEVLPGGPYYPVIVDITTSGNTKTLLVAYTQSSSAEVLGGADTGHVGKYMEYVMIKDGGEYYLYAIREADMQDE